MMASIRDLLDDRNISVYRLAKISGLSYSTANDIVNDRTDLKKCSAETVYRIARALDISMEELLEAKAQVRDPKRSSFENFKSALCHRVKEMGDLDFILDTLEKDEIRSLYERKWYPESLYLLAMVDYLSRENGIPLCSDYDDLRGYKLEKQIYPSSVLAISVASGNDEEMKKAARDAIPEFKRFNIIESDIRNVI